MSACNYAREVCEELEKKLTRLSKERITGKVIVEINMSQGGIGESHVNIFTKEALRPAMTGK